MLERDLQNLKVILVDVIIVDEFLRLFKRINGIDKRKYGQERSDCSGGALHALPTRPAQYRSYELPHGPALHFKNNPDRTRLGEGTAPSKVYTTLRCGRS